MAAGVAVGFAAPATAGDILAWRTDDGGYAFADDPDAVPERYRDRVEVRRSAAITGYRRYTAEDEAATSRYEEGLAARLEHLRRQAEAEAPEAARGTGAAPDYLTIRSGSKRGGVDLATPMGGADAPLQTETVYMRRNGGVLTQPVRVTRRGDKIISVQKPRNTWRGLDEVVSERELDAALGE